MDDKIRQYELVVKAIFRGTVTGTIVLTNPKYQSLLSGEEKRKRKKLNKIRTKAKPKKQNWAIDNEVSGNKWLPARHGYEFHFF